MKANKKDINQASKSEEAFNLPSSSESEYSSSGSESEEVSGLSSDEELKISTKGGAERTHKVSGHTIKKAGASNKGDDKHQDKARGVIYLSRIPHGFYENEMKKYFTQFGDIKNLKISRNKKTGKSKHYGFIEFDNVSVAQVASETMNNYLLFGHLLKCEVINQESIPETLFDNKKSFKRIPWSKISKNKNDKAKSKEKWTQLSDKYEKRKLSKQERLKSKGIDFDLSLL